jgi:hypothetical protein
LFSELSAVEIIAIIEEERRRFDEMEALAWVSLF